MNLNDMAKKSGKAAADRLKKQSSPVWQGPEKDGITFSLLSRFLCCRERFRLLVVEGLKPRDTFNPRMGFGNMWHVMEDAWAKTAGLKIAEEELSNYVAVLGKRYPFQREQIEHWWSLALVMFPEYVQHWQRHPDVQNRTPLLQEQVFDVPYRLPSGRTVRLRGKWDSVDLVDDGVWLQENKTKSSIDKRALERQLSFDLQTMIYLVALKSHQVDRSHKHDEVWDNDLKGVRYNVVRRPAHKTAESALRKLLEDQRNGRSEEWFCRWQVSVSEQDIARFRRQCLDPVLEQLCDWWDTVSRMPKDPFQWEGHFRFPYGVWNATLEGGASDLDHYMESGSEAGLQRTTDLFPELKGL